MVKLPEPERLKRATAKRKTYAKKAEAAQKLKDEVFDLLKRAVSNREFVRLIPAATLGVSGAVVFNTPWKLSYLLTLPFVPLSGFKLQGPGFTFTFDVDGVRTKFLEFIRAAYGDISGLNEFPLGVEVFHASLITLSALIVQDFMKAFGTALRENTGDVLEALPT